jgi:thioredoxin 1
MVENITDETFTKFVETNPIAVIDCWADWCFPCKVLGPVIEELSRERVDIAFAKLNVDKNRAVPIKYGIMSIPTLLYFKNGKLADKTIGAIPKEAIKKRLEKISD